MSVLFPRLPDSVAGRIYAQVAALPTQELTAMAATRHEMQYFAATGGARATEGHLRAVRGLIVDIATQHGFPNDTRRFVRFDRQLAPRLHDVMGVVPAEAANRHVWSFMALVIAPDVTRWRFEGTNLERWVATDLTRHMFARLWWQAHLLVEFRGASPDTTLLDSLSESDLNQLLERTTIGGMRPLVRSLARSVLAARTELPRRLVIREASLRMRRRMAFIDHFALDAEQIRVETDSAVHEAISSLMSEPPIVGLDS